MAQHEEPLDIVHEEVHAEELAEHDEPIDHVEGDEEELYEEINGRIVQAEDGRFFVATDVDAIDVDFDTINKIEVIVNLDGTETVIFEADAVAMDEQEGVEGQKDSKDNIRIANISGRTNHILDEEMEVGAMTTAEDAENGIYLNAYEDSDLKYGRRNRKHGKAVCPECNQSFVNTARLERHLSVHQIFGSFLCQLCGKTYKYEYNLFYHWRKTCRDLLEYLPDEEDRKKIDVNELRELVEHLASKKSSFNNMELGISSQPLFRNINADVLDERRSKRHVSCQSCGVNILAAHMPKHRNVHNGTSSADQPSVAGGYFCDLCGLIFRHKANLYKHWRTNCSEIMANLPQESDLTMDDDALRQMVEDLLKKHSINFVDEKILKTDAERARALDSLTADLNIDMTGIPDGEETEDETQNSNIFDQKWIENHGIVFADDLPEGSPYLEMARGSGVHPFGQNNSKYNNQTGEVLQCPECFKPFMSVSRLEKHMAGYHASSGTHHCPLCGNRFKYDYNLLYHYRRSCPYTKAFIDRDVREQIDSTSLRKLVRNLALQQPALPSNFSSRLNSITQNDAFVHKQMMQGDEKLPVTKIPPHNVQPPRPNLPHGYRCPHCNIIFYGTTAIKLHMKMRHHEEFEVKQPDDNVQEEIITEMPHDTLSGGIDDLPPKLELEEHKPAPRHRIYDEQGNDITNTPEVQQLIASGEIQFQDGEEIILVDQGANGEHMEYYEEPEPSPERTTRQRQSSRNYPVETIEVMNEEIVPSASPSTRRSTRLSRSYKNQDDLEMEGQENEYAEIQQEEEPTTSKRTTRRKKDEEMPPPSNSPVNRRQARNSESAEASPRRSLRSRPAR